MNFFMSSYAVDINCAVRALVPVYASSSRSMRLRPDLCAFVYISSCTSKVAITLALKAAH